MLAGSRILLGHMAYHDSWLPLSCTSLKAAHSNGCESIPQNSQIAEMTNFPSPLQSVCRRQLGTTGLTVPCVAFGAGPVPALWTVDDPARHDAALRRAIERGVNWIDTAAGYGAGASERNLGGALRRLNAYTQLDLATKVRIEAADRTDLPGAIRRSVEGSLERLGVSKVRLLQLHNSVTRHRDDEPTSLAVSDVLGAGGVADTLDRLRAEGLCDLIGFTGLGDGESLCEVARSGRFQTMQTPFSLANPTAGYAPPPGWTEANYGQVCDECARQGMGVFAIRVFAGGALARRPPSDYTRQTRFFKLDLYERDLERASRMAARLPVDVTLPAAALRFPFSHPAVSAIIIGFSTVDEIDEGVEYAAAGRLDAALCDRLLDALSS